jgi:hypothetical protein
MYWLVKDRQTKQITRQLLDKWLQIIVKKTMGGEFPGQCLIFHGSTEGKIVIRQFFRRARNKSMLVIFIMLQ